MRVDKARADLDKVRDLVKEVLAVKAELPAVVEMVKPLGAIRSEVGTLGEQVQDVSGRFAKVREEHQKIAGEAAAALSRLAGVEKQIKDAKMPEPVEEPVGRAARAARAAGAGALRRHSPVGKRFARASRAGAGGGAQVHRVAEER